MSKIGCHWPCHLVPSQYLLQGEEKGPVGNTVKVRGGVLATETAEICSSVELLYTAHTARISGSGVIWAWTRFPWLSVACGPELVRGYLCSPTPVSQGQQARESVTWEAVRVPLHHGLLHLKHFLTPKWVRKLRTNCREHGNWDNTKAKGIQKGL